MTNLEPCPFCGGELTVVDSPWLDGTSCWIYKHVDFVKAAENHCPLEVAGYKTKQEAIDALNTRYKRTCKWKAVCDERFWDTECGMTYECYDAAEPPKHCCECGGAVVLVVGSEVIND